MLLVAGKKGEKLIFGKGYWQLQEEIKWCDNKSAKHGLYMWRQHKESNVSLCVHLCTWKQTHASPTHRTHTPHYSHTSPPTHTHTTSHNWVLKKALSLHTRTHTLTQTNTHSHTQLPTSCPGGSAGITYGITVLQNNRSSLPLAVCSSVILYSVSLAKERTFLSPGPRNTLSEQEKAMYGEHMEKYSDSETFQDHLLQSVLFLLSES